MDQQKLYYDNIGKGSIITRELMVAFFQELAKNLSADDFLSFVSNSRVPNERELYGIIVKSIIGSCGDKVSHIATEFSVTRSGENENASKGRVDLIFNYRSVSYLIEIKVGRVNVHARNENPRKKAKTIWHDAIEQLEALDVSSVKQLMKNKVVKLPVALYFFTGSKDEDINHHLEIHENILNFIKMDANGKKNPKFFPNFELYSAIPRTATRFRKTDLSDDENTYLHGFSIFAKQENSAQ